MPEEVIKWGHSFNPRNWQEKALNAWGKKSRGIVSVVTGAGKTIFAQMCILNLAKRVDDFRIIILVPTISLMDQWYVSLIEDLNVSESDISLFGGNNKYSKPRKINISTLNTARKLINDIKGNTKCFLIVDECHKIGSLENAKILDNRFDYTLGLSATPVREFDNNFEELIRPKLGEIIYEYNYESAFKDKIIVPFSLVNVKIELYPHEKNQYDNLSKKIAYLMNKYKNDKSVNDILRPILQRRAAVSANALNRIPVAAKIILENKEKRSIIFHERINAVDSISNMLNKLDITNTKYHTKIGPKLRQDNLRLFRKGIYDCLVTCRALDEGLNVPDLNLSVIAASTSSVRQRIQRLGRVLRTTREKRVAQVYTIYATKAEEIRLLRESNKLKEISETTWINATITK